MLKVPHPDLDRMQTMGRLVAKKDDLQAFETAAEYLAVAQLESHESYQSLWIWFEEGARNCVDGMYHLDDIQRRLRERVNELLQENNKHKHKLHVYGDRYRCSICGGNTFTEADFLKEG